MTKRSQKPNAPAKGVTLGRTRFAKISAVEGIVISPAARKRAEEAEQLGLSGPERRRRIARAYDKN